MAGLIREKSGKRANKCPSSSSGEQKGTREERGLVIVWPSPSESHKSEQWRTRFHLPGQWASSINHRQIITTSIKK